MAHQPKSEETHKEENHSDKKERMWSEAKASGRRNRVSEESKTQESQEEPQTCDQTTPTPEKVKDQQTQEKDDEPQRAAETAVVAHKRRAGHNFRLLMYKTGTARMLRQGMGGKRC